MNHPIRRCLDAIHTPRTRGWVAVLAASMFVPMMISQAAAAELTLLRYGPAGQEKPGLRDDQGQIRDLSAHINDWTPENLADEVLERIADLPVDQLPLVNGDVRLGNPVTGSQKIMAIGFNYIDHAAEMAVDVPEEPLFLGRNIP